jgi:hypothetical protein
LGADIDDLQLVLQAVKGEAGGRQIPGNS